MSRSFGPALPLLLLPVLAAGDDWPALGEALAPDDIAALDFVVMPDGEGLPGGSGNAVQGEVIYQEHCVACHGDEGVGGLSDTLAGGHGTITSDEPVKTVGSYWPYATTVFDYIRRAMPYQDPDVLDDDDVYAVTAYLLYVNGIIGAEDRLDATSLPNVEMPNRDGFVWAWQGER